MINFDNAEFELCAGNAKQLPKSILPEVVFSGRSNVGKSTLINKLLNRKSLARVSNNPGKTATINFYKLNGFRFVDLPGYGFAKVSHAEKLRWADLVESYFNMNRKIMLVTELLDARHPPTKQDVDMINYLKNRNINFALVFTKCDKLNKTEMGTRKNLLPSEIQGFETIKKVYFSSKTGEGLKELKSLVVNSL